MSDQRMHQRVSLSKSVHVINLMTGSEYGRVVNLSESGVLIASREQMKVGDIFQLSLVLVEQEMTISIGVECVWAEPQKTNLIFGGFKIIDIANNDLSQLRQVIQQSTVD